MLSCELGDRFVNFAAWATASVQVTQKGKAFSSMELGASAIVFLVLSAKLFNVGKYGDQKKCSILFSAR